jgi:hypothetical protein
MSTQPRKYLVGLVHRGSGGRDSARGEDYPPKLGYTYTDLVIEDLLGASAMR